VLTRGAVVAEDVPGGFAGVYRVLAAAEESGRVRRGYFVESLGAAQFGSTGAIDRLRAGARPVGADPRGTGAPALVLAATDPANPFGAALPWPDRSQGSGDDAGDAGTRKGHQPGRKAGALVVMVDGELVLYVERGGKTLLSWTEEPEALQSAADALALAVREGALGRLTVEKADGDALLGSGHPVVAALAQAGFHATPRGLRLRR
jgi:ATP-dependent Lhr-like helicase